MLRTYKGDLEIKAQGTSSLMQKEVRSQRLMTFMQTASNPALAPFVRWHTCLTEIAKSLDIDPDQLINDPEKAAIYAQIMGMANGNQNNTTAAGGQGQMGQDWSSTSRSFANRSNRSWRWQHRNRQCTDARGSWL